MKQIALIFGSYHTFMNLLVARGKLMDGTGLESDLDVVYGENTAYAK